MLSLQAGDGLIQFQFVLFTTLNQMQQPSFCHEDIKQGQYCQQEAKNDKKIIISKCLTIKE